jgi:hypothetical protein
VYVVLARRHATSRLARLCECMQQLSVTAAAAAAAPTQPLQSGQWLLWLQTDMAPASAAILPQPAPCPCKQVQAVAAANEACLGPPHTASVQPSISALTVRARCLWPRTSGSCQPCHTAASLQQWRDMLPLAHTQFPFPWVEAHTMPHRSRTPPATARTACTCGMPALLPGHGRDHKVPHTCSGN